MVRKTKWFHKQYTTRHIFLVFENMMASLSNLIQMTFETCDWIHQLSSCKKGHVGIIFWWWVKLGNCAIFHSKWWQFFSFIDTAIQKGSFSISCVWVYEWLSLYSPNHDPPLSIFDDITFPHRFSLQALAVYWILSYNRSKYSTNSTS